MVWVRVARRVAAWALPRPSATASARLAKTTVAHSHAVTVQANTDGVTTANTVVSAEPTSTMNITGLRTRVFGFSFRTALGRLRHSIAGSSSPPETRADPLPAAGTEVPAAGASGWRVGVVIS